MYNFSLTFARIHQLEFIFIGNPFFEHGASKATSLVSYHIYVHFIFLVFSICYETSNRYYFVVRKILEKHCIVCLIRTRERKRNCSRLVLFTLFGHCANTFSSLAFLPVSLALCVLRRNEIENFGIK